MGFWKTLFGGEDPTPEQAKQNADDRQFDLMKYDGVKALRMGQTDYAVKCFREALKVRDDMETRDYLSQALVRMGLLDEAQEVLRTMMAAHPDNPAVVLEAAQVAFMQEDYSTMTTLCEQAIALHADNPLSYYFYARAALGQGDPVSAIARLTKALGIDEQMGDARLLRAQTLLTMGDIPGAREDTDWLLEHTEDHEDVLMLHARVTAAEGNAEQAIAIYSQAIDANPFNVEAYRERGRVRYNQGDHAGALEDMEKVLELSPEEAAGVNGEFTAEGIEQKVKQAYSFMNPLGI